MSLININLNLVAYADDGKTTNPAVKFTDLSWSLLGLPTDTPRMVPIALAPNETRVIMTTARAISYTGSTSFQIVQVPNTSQIRLTANLGQRTARSDGEERAHYSQ